MSEQSFIPLVDLKAQYATIKDEVGAAIAEVMTRGDFILGRDVAALEEEFPAFCDTTFGVGCGNGTDALELAARALDIGPGDEVVVPAMTFAATALAVRLAGATPVLVDVDPDTALMIPEAAEAAITERTKAILPVHLFGQCADMTALGDIAKAKGLKVIEDAAQAHGADHGGKKAGSMSDIACFSFYPGKNLGAYGDAGMAVTGDEGLANRMKQIRNLGAPAKYLHDEVAPNTRMDTFQAAVLRIKLRRLQEWTDARRRHARAYDEALAGIDGLTLTRSDAGSVHHLYVVRCEERDRVLKALNDAGIGAGMHYPFALHQLKAFADLGHSEGDFPGAEDWARRCISLPIYAELPAEAAPRAAEVLNAEVR